MAAARYQQGDLMTTRHVSFARTLGVATFVADTLDHEEWDDDADTAASQSAAQKLRAAERAGTGTVDLTDSECVVIGMTICGADGAGAYDEEGAEFLRSLRAFAHRCYRRTNGGSRGPT